jgi:hypothetical protein
MERQGERTSNIPRYEMERKTTQSRFVRIFEIMTDNFPAWAFGYRIIWFKGAKSSR